MKRLLASIIVLVLVAGPLPAYTVAPSAAAAPSDVIAPSAAADHSARAAQSDYTASTSAQLQLAPQADSAARYSFDSAGLQTGPGSVQVSAESLGIGGGGALFAPAISPHDPKTFITGCDMGGVYVTHDAGDSWARHELTGQTMYAVAFDPSRSGYVYAGSSGLARSRDNGDTWELLWPKPTTIVADPNTYESIRHYYYNTGNWMATASVRAIAVDSSDSTHLYILVSGYLEAFDWNLGWELFESSDDGATFSSMGVAPYEARGIDEGCDDPRPSFRRASSCRETAKRSSACTTPTVPPLRAVSGTTRSFRPTSWPTDASRWPRPWTLRPQTAPTGRAPRCGSSACRRTARSQSPRISRTSWRPPGMELATPPRTSRSRATALAAAPSRRPSLTCVRAESDCTS